MLMLLHFGRHISGSIYFTMAITVERYLSVCHPFYRVRHTWPPWFFVVPIAVFSVVYNLPTFFELTTNTYTDHYVRVGPNNTVRLYLQHDVNGTLVPAYTMPQNVTIDPAWLDGDCKNHTFPFEMK